MKGYSVRYPFGIMRKVLPTFGLLLLLASAVSASAQDGPRRVLVLHSTRSNLPVNVDWYAGITRSDAATAGPQGYGRSSSTTT